MSRDRSLTRLLEALDAVERADSTLPVAAPGSHLTARTSDLAGFWPRLRALQAKVSQRRAVAPGVTVVALLGATGVGKSSLFNALCGVQIAPVSVLRPTTSRAFAAVSTQSTLVARPLLEQLGISTVRQAALPPGLVLVDLPDLDSTSTEHRVEALRVAEVADVLLWVLDPQKYADAAVLQEAMGAYLRHGSVTEVVLNKADALGRDDVAAVTAHLETLLPAGLRVHPVSAVTGWGIEALAQDLAERAGQAQSAVERLHADAVQLGEQVAGALPADSVSADWGELTTALVRSCGVSDVEAQARASYRREAQRYYNFFARVGRKVLPTAPALVPARPNLSGVTEALEEVERGLVSPAGVEERAEMLSFSSEEVLRGASLAPAKRRWWAVLGALATLGGLLLAAALVWFVALGFSQAVGWPLVKAPLHLLGLGSGLAQGTWLGDLPTPTLLLAVAALLLAISLGCGALAVGVGAKRHGKVVVQRIEADLGNLVIKQVGGRLEPYVRYRAELAAAGTQLAGALADAC